MSAANSSRPSPQVVVVPLSKVSDRSSRVERCGHVEGTVTKMPIDQIPSGQRFGRQLTFLTFFIFMVVSLLPSSDEIWAKTIKSQQRPGIAGTLTSGSTTKRKQKSSTRRSRRHRRLKISR